MGIFPKWSDPPPAPPVWERPCQKYRFFPEEIFFLEKKHVLAPQDDAKQNLANRQKKVGLGQTPPLAWEKFPRKVVFFWRTSLTAIWAMPK